MSGKYFIFSIRRPAAASSLCAALVLIAFGFLVSPSNGIPVAFPADETASSTTTAPAPSTTVKILIPPSSSSDNSQDDDDDVIIIEAGNGTSSPLPREPFNPNDCFMDKEKGPCRAIIESYFFNKETKTCELFQYSGCGGNGNRFSDKIECDSRCGTNGKSNGNGTDQTSENDGTSDDDAIVIEAGRDEDNNNNGTCPEFDGCGPLKCAVIKDEKTGCKKCACNLLPEDNEAKLPVGSVSGTPSEDDNEKMKKEKPEDICGLPEVRGSCRAMLTRFRYDAKVKKCIMFHFGGCDSNGNNFVSEDKCNEFCKGQ